jgi:hypothetical protein
VRRLVAIPISPFCEEARWALERAGLEYREERHVRGIHRIGDLRAFREHPAAAFALQLFRDERRVSVRSGVG